MDNHMQTLSERQKLILKTVIKAYFKTAQPVSSGILVEKYKLDLSPATVRNEMMDLEESGYIFQPHTSAGRVPTAAAYQLYIDELPGKRLSASDASDIDDIFSLEEIALKKTARKISDLSEAAVFWAFHKNDLYYTGLSNLFAQPEFKQTGLAYDFSKVIDRLEEIIDDNFNNWPLGRQVLLGANNPFGDFLGAVLIKYRHGSQSGVLGVLGPLRLDYERVIALADHIAGKFNPLV
jgi:heat-inducible transcriptional repressor